MLHGFALLHNKIKFLSRRTVSCVMLKYDYKCV
jgi:hypothetical protein